VKKNWWFRIRDGGGKNKGKETTINSPAHHATVIKHWRLFVGQWDSKKGLLRSTERLRTVNAKLSIFHGQRAMDNARRASPADTKSDRGRVGMGLGKGLGVLLPGVTASFLSNDACIYKTKHSFTLYLSILDISLVPHRFARWSSNQNIT
jgi:hypothetical protein